VFQPVGGELVINDSVTRAGRKFQNEKEAQARTDNERQDGVRENSLHACFASYNTGDIVPLDGVTLA
jgi:hypothetical protein